MPQDINLLPQETAANKQQAKQKKMINLISVVVLLVAVLAIAGLFTANLLINSQLADTDNQINSQKRQIEAKRTDEGIYRALQAKVDTLSSFFAQQKHYSTFLKAFGQTLPSTMKLTDVNIDASNAAQISGTVTSYADLAGFYDKLQQTGSKDGQPGTYFVDPLLTSISHNNQSGDITFTLQFTIGAPALAVQETS